MHGRRMLVLAASAMVLLAGENRASFAADKSQPQTSLRADGSNKWDVPVAIVNGEPITREELADELMEMHAKGHIENMINRRIIAQACKAKKVNVTKEEIEDDLSATFKKFRVSRKEFVETALVKRGLTLAQYIRETVWPALALKKLVEAEGLVKVTNEDLQKGLEANYGEKVDVRMLIVLELRRAQELWTQVNDIKDPEARLKFFEDCCKTFSIDAASQPHAGEVQPIHRHYPHPELEKLAFGLKPGELSKVTQVHNGHLIFYCVKRIEPQKNITLDSIINPETKETVRVTLTNDLKEKRTRLEVQKYFVELHKKAKIDDYIHGDLDSIKSARDANDRQPTKGVGN